MAQVERGHDQDMLDVDAMFTIDLIEPGKLLGFFKEIEPFLYKYPAIAPSIFAQAVEIVVESWKKRRS